MLNSTVDNLTSPILISPGPPGAVATSVTARTASETAGSGADSATAGISITSPNPAPTSGRSIHDIDSAVDSAVDSTVDSDADSDADSDSELDSELDSDKRLSNSSSTSSSPSRGRVAAAIGKGACTGPAACTRARVSGGGAGGVGVNADSRPAGSSASTVLIAACSSAG